MGSTDPVSPVRLAVLEADVPVPGVAAKYGSYGGVFRHLFERACAADTTDQPGGQRPRPRPGRDALTAQLQLTAHDVVNDPASYPDPDSIDAVLITGSKHTAFDDDDWIVRLVRYTARLLDGGRVRVIGVCFGQQIVARALGAPVGRSSRGWEVSVTELRLTEQGRALFGRDTLRIQQMHRDSVERHPAGTIPLGETAVCATQGMYIPGRVLAVQGHPEFDEEMVREILTTRHRSGIIDDDVYEDAMRRVGYEHDGVLIALAFLRFLRE